MTNEANGPNENARRRIDAHLDAIDEALIASGMSRSERRSITDDVEAQIVEMLSSRAGPSPGLADVEAVLAELDPPEAYAGASTREGTTTPPPPPMPAPVPKSARPRFSRTAILGAIWAGLFLAILVPATSLWFFRSDRVSSRPMRVAQQERSVVITTKRLESASTQPGAVSPDETTPEQLPATNEFVDDTDMVMTYPTKVTESPPPFTGTEYPTRMISIFGLLLFLPAILILGAPVGTTVLGLVAVSQIRRSAGRLYGLGLALFDAILFPLLLLDIGIWGLLHCALASVTSANTATILAVAVLACLIVDFLLIRWAWRSVNRPHPSAAARIACPR